MHQRVDTGARNSKDRHRLGSTVDRGAPVLPEEEQDRRDERPGVPDADPPDEVDNIEAPGNRNINPPDANADGKQHRQRVEIHQQSQGCKDEPQRPAPRGSFERRQHNVANGSGNRFITLLGPSNSSSTLPYADFCAGCEAMCYSVCPRRGTSADHPPYPDIAAPMPSSPLRGRGSDSGSLPDNSHAVLY